MFTIPSKKISPDEFSCIARLAGLEIPKDREAELLSELCEIVEFTDSLSELDTSGVPETTQVFPLENALREDAVGEALVSDALLFNAPQREKGASKAPRII